MVEAQESTEVSPEIAAPAAWGKAVLEELLFMGAEGIGRNGAEVEVALSFRVHLAPDEEGLEIALRRTADPDLLLTLTLPF